MKIGIEAECLTRPIRGCEYYTLTLIEGLRMLHQNLTCFHTRNTPFPHVPSVSHYYFRRPLPLPLYYSLAALSHNKCFNGVDLMHFPVPRVLYLRRPKIPFVITVHDLIPLLNPQLSSRKTTYLFRYCIGRYLHAADAIITVSETTKRDLLRFFDVSHEKVHVVHGALLPKPRASVAQKKPYLLYIGSFEKRKNVARIIDAFALLCKEIDSYTLILAGKVDENVRQLIPKIKKLKLHNKVIFKGYVSEEAKEKLYQEAELLVWPSLYEGFGYPLLEAMSYGTPIVTSPLDTTKEIVREAAVYVSAVDPKSIANGISSILTSLQLKQSLIKEGLRRAHDFSLETMAKKTLEIYESIY